jgi:hypothetical protein
MSRLKVWQVVQLFAQISEEHSRQLCQEFIDAAELNLSINDFADDSTEHIEFVEHMYEICSEETESVPQVTTGDPFFYSRKVSPSDISKYTVTIECSYYCSICGDNYNQGGVHLSCDNRNNCCTFCKECIMPWLTENVAKCPNCSLYVRPII